MHWRWITIFGVLFLLTQDYLLPLQWTDNLVFGIPNWWLYFAIFHIIFIVCLVLFVRARNERS